MYSCTFGGDFLCQQLIYTPNGLMTVKTSLKLTLCTNPPSVALSRATADCLQVLRQQRQWRQQQQQQQQQQ
jgi:hypothetical protein